MELKIDGDNILKEKKKIGTIRRSCCGTDIRLDKHPALFSVMRVQKSEKKKLIRIVEKLLSVEGVQSGHFNLRMETVEDEKEFERYAKAISKP